jgi:hypothetical protein
MKQYGFFYMLALSAMLVTCGSSVKVVHSWRNAEIDVTQKVYRYIFIAALTDNFAAKQTIEADLAAAVERRGYTVIKSSEAFPLPASGSKPPDKETMMQRVKETKADGIFTVALLKKETESRYVPGSANYAPYPRFTYYGSFGGYYNNAYGSWYTNPGYYSNDKTYYLESNLFDAETEKIVWSAQSETYNPSGLSSFSKQYTDAMIKQLEKDKLLIKL